MNEEQKSKIEENLKILTESIETFNCDMPLNEEDYGEATHAAYEAIGSIRDIINPPLDDTQLKDKVRQHLEEAYGNGRFRPSDDDFENELLDIFEEIRDHFDGSFEDWLRRKQEMQKVHDAL